MLRRFEAGGECWDGLWCTRRGFSDTKEVLEGAGRDLGVLMGFYAITPNHVPGSTWLVLGGTALPQEHLKKTV